MRCCNPSNVLCYCPESSVPSAIWSILVPYALLSRHLQSSAATRKQWPQAQSCLVEMCMIGCIPNTQQHQKTMGTLSTSGLSIIDVNSSSHLETLSQTLAKDADHQISL